MPTFLRMTKVRLSLLSTLVFAVAMGLAAGGFWIALAHFEYGAVDTSLRDQVHVILSDLEDQNGQVTIAGGSQLPGETTNGVAVPVFVVAPTGQIIARSPQDPRAIPYPLASGRLPASGVRDLSIRGSPARVLVERVSITGQGVGALVLVRSTADVQGTLGAVALLLGAAWAAVVGIAFVVSYFLAGRALHPVRLMAATAQEISQRDLHRRITLDLPREDELATLAATLNGMLERLESAFFSLQRFTADASHELRAPLALMRAHLEVILNRERRPSEYQAACLELLSEVERLSRTSEQLLLLARADSGSLQARMAFIDLPDLLEEVRDRWMPRCAEHDIELAFEMPEVGAIVADADLLRRLLDNLIDNAIRYTPARGRVTIAVRNEDRRWTLTVQDQGPGIDPSVQTSLFERFTRGDPARSRETGGAGLGLSLCAAIAEAHGGSIGLVDSDRGQGASFVVTLPHDPSNKRS
ncbi:MAG: sensor histidine kinase [Candidatus Dormibacteraceae bacterium]